MQPTESGRDLPRRGDAGNTSGPSPQRGGRFRLRNWRVPQRLVVLVLIPTVAAVVLGGFRIATATTEADAFGRVEKLARLGNGVTTLVHEFSAERDLAAGYIAAGRPAGLGAQVQAQFKKVDAVTGQVGEITTQIDDSFSEDAVRDARLVQSRVDGIRSLREIVTGSQVSANTVVDKYSESIGELIGILDGIAQDVGDDRLAETSRALGSLSRAKEQISRQRALLAMGVATGQFSSDELSSLVTARAQEDSELVAFRQAARLDQRQMVEDTVVGREIDLARQIRQQAITAATNNGGQLPNRLVADSARLQESITAMVDRMRLAERRLGDELLSYSQDQKGAAQNSALADGAIAAFLLLAVLLITSLMARSLVRPLRRLRDGALEVAGSRLPGLVERLRDPQAAASGIEVEPVDIDSTDEIGQVARAFDEVHREAVRLAADEAVLRGNINAMFVNLSRRSQSLIERQLRLIDELEQGEQDEERLASLFRLDHLATRMRRNCENLLVLGGQEQVRRWNQPVPLIDIVRASLSEVEQYDRVGLRVQGDVAVVGPVVNDLVHLAAELVENATAFSPEHTKVTVSGHLLSGGGAMLQITDNGVGMSPEDLEAANWRLANPPVIDFSAARRMGLFVVGRLAVRHGIRVELRPALSGGITAFVLLPAALIARGGETGALAPRRFDSGQSGQSVPAASAAWSAAPVTAGPAPTPALGAGPTLGQLAGAGTVPDTPFGAIPEPMHQSGPMPVTGGALPPGGPHYGGQTGPQPTVPGTGANELPKRQPGAAHHQAVPHPRRPEPPAQPLGQPTLAARLPGFPPPGERGETARPSAQRSALGGGENGASWGGGEEPNGSSWSNSERPTGELPIAPERSPIFDAMESEWFQRRTASRGGRMSEPWQSPGDSGWQAAEAVREPAAGGTTQAGLPKRVPGRNRVPGSPTPATAPQQPAPAAPPQPPAQSAEVIRNRFASLQQGVHRGRNQLRSDDGSLGEGPGGGGLGQGDTERGAS